MGRDEIIKEIQRAEKVLQTTNSRKLRHDYGKHLKRLYQNLKYYDGKMKTWQTNRT
jgi:hypothetical protein